MLKIAIFMGILMALAFFVESCHSQEINAETASWYSTQSCQKEGTSGIFTASGEKFDENALTCAMRSRDFGKYYRVTNLANGKSVIVKHNDFGPNKKLHKKGRIVDLSKGAFKAIANLKRGIVNVKVEAIN
jgi:rare lipoprotein A